MVKSRWVYRRGGRHHGVEEVFCVVGCQKGVDVEVPERAISRGGEKIFSATYIRAMPRAVLLREDGVGYAARFSMKMLKDHWGNISK